MGFMDSFNSTMGWFKENPETANLIGATVGGVGGYFAESALQKSEHKNDIELEELKQKHKLEFSDHELAEKDERTNWATGVDTSFDANVAGDKGALTGGGLLSRIQRG